MAIIAIGGDGTIGEVINGLQAEVHQPPVAVCPTGTWNILADALHLPAPHQLAQAIQRGHTRRLPLFEVRWISEGQQRQRYAFLGIDFGVGASVVAATERQKTGQLGRFLPSMLWQYVLGPYYLATARSHCISSGAGTVVIRPADRSADMILESSSVVMLWAHARSPWDGRYDQLHVSLSTTSDLPPLPNLLAFFALRQIYHGMAQISATNKAVESFDVTAADDFDFLIDGELCRGTSVTVRVCDDVYVDVFAPPKSAKPPV